MIAAEIIAALAEHRTRVVVTGERVRLVYPRQRPPPRELVAIAREHKAELRVAIEERAAIAEQGGVPPIYAMAFAAMQAGCPSGVDEARWRAAIDDAGRFLDDWGKRAAALGWMADDLFGLTPMPDRVAPSFDRLARCDHLGLVWLLRGRRVVDLTADAAVIRTKTGSPLRFYKPHRG
jgi:hypothetical protein